MVDKTTAEAFRIALACGFITYREVIGIADDCIDREDEPGEALIEISTAHDINELISALGAVDGVVQAERLSPLILRLTAGFREANPREHKKIIRALFRLLTAREVQFTEQEEGAIFHLDDAYDLAATRTWGDSHSVARELKEFLSPYLEREYPELQRS